MELNITYDEDGEQVTVLYDNYLCVTARRNSRGTICYSDNIDEIGQDDVVFAIQKICSLMLSLHGV